VYIWSASAQAAEFPSAEDDTMTMNSSKRFYLSAAWTAAAIVGGLALLISFVTRA
jgi:hypothetical protein